MKDVLVPTIVGRVIKNKRLVLKAVDKEYSVCLQGTYRCQAVNGRQFVLSVSQNRGEIQFSGWMIQAHHCLDVMPLNSEIWLLGGKLEGDGTQARGAIQRKSSVGKNLGKVGFKMSINSDRTMVLEVLGLKDHMTFVVSEDMVKQPAFREEAVVQNDNL